MFQCEAENEAGSDSISTWLKVKSKYIKQFCFKYIYYIIIKLVESE